MRTRPLFTLLILLLSAVPTALVAAPRAKPAYNAVTIVDPSDHSVTIAPMNSSDIMPRTFRVDARTEIVVNGKKATFKDLKIGWKANYVVSADSGVLSRLALSPAPRNSVVGKRR